MLYTKLSCGKRPEVLGTQWENRYTYFEIIVDSGGGFIPFREIESAHSKPHQQNNWFGLFSLFNGISTFVGDLMPKPSWAKNSSDTIYPIADEDKEVHTFPHGICPKVNVIARLGFELTDFAVRVHQFSYFTSVTTPGLLIGWYCEISVDSNQWRFYLFCNSF